MTFNVGNVYPLLTKIQFLHKLWYCSASDLRFTGRGFEFWQGAPPLGKLLTPVCPCHQAV